MGAAGRTEHAVAPKAAGVAVGAAVPSSSKATWSRRSAARQSTPTAETVETAREIPAARVAAAPAHRARAPATTVPTAAAVAAARWVARSFAELRRARSGERRARHSRRAVRSHARRLKLHEAASKQVCPELRRGPRLPTCGEVQARFSSGRGAGVRFQFLFDESVMDDCAILALWALHILGVGQQRSSALGHSAVRDRISIRW
jgi:hypothetical protein